MDLQRETVMSTSRPVALALPVAAAISLSMFVVTLAALHLLRPDLSPVTSFVSEYAVGDYGFFMLIAFLAMSIASFALITGLWYSLPADARSTTGLILIGIWGIGMISLAIFPIGIGETVDTPADIIHRTTALIVFLTVSVGTLLVSRGFHLNDDWRRLARPGIALSILLLIGYIATFGGYAVDSGFEGLSQRLFLVVLVIWMGMVMWRIWFRKPTVP